MDVRSRSHVQGPRPQTDFSDVEVRSLFDRQSARWTAKYAEDGQLQHRIERFVAAVQSCVPVGSAVLDFGCGSGHIGAALHACGYSVRGVDASRNMIEVARRSFGEKIEFDTVGARLSFPENSLDAVVASSVFEYPSDPQYWLTELARVSKSGAALMMTVPNTEHIVRRYERVERPVLTRLKKMLPVPLKRRAEYLALSRNRLSLAQWEEMLGQSDWQFEACSGADHPLLLIVGRRLSRDADSKPSPAKDAFTVPRNLAENAGNLRRSKPRVAVFSLTYLPGFKAGGPVRSVSNMIEHLAGSFDFRVITRDRDVGDAAPYRGVAPNEWRRVGAASVYYCHRANLRTVYEALRQAKPDLIYLNSFYETFTRQVLLLRKLRCVPLVPIVISPRGEFAPEAMGIKSTRKAVFRLVTRIWPLYEGLQWQVSSDKEKADLIRESPSWDFSFENVFLAEELTEPPSKVIACTSKQPGHLKLAFVARISPMKNVEHLFRSLARVRGKIEVNLYGPVADADREYWAGAQKLLGELPQNVVVRHHGAVDHAAVRGILQQHHFMILPTRGENFCHSAVEAFSAGVPVILSDATPWRNLEAQYAGFDLPLDDPDRWLSVLQRCVEMQSSEYDRFRDGARQYRSHIKEDEVAAKHRKLFQQLISSNRARTHEL
jgi:glycosyltransferase involved in cell wall biosynthesis/ubiquinone/menaquinone biosynthesis C-methylase UbiE